MSGSHAWATRSRSTPDPDGDGRLHTTHSTPVGGHRGGRLCWRSRSSSSDLEFLPASSLRPTWPSPSSTCRSARCAIASPTRPPLSRPAQRAHRRRRPAPDAVASAPRCRRRLRRGPRAHEGVRFVGRRGWRSGRALTSSTAADDKRVKRVTSRSGR
jgi:hypothetical protein